ncbi:MAG: SDR family NAD(P)-dependent oxidoreductase [Bacteroidetes bacterium]|nr:SDR family NAD(P)-dependent oxidoreductase [Bacteroidota bacterium]
MKTVSIMGCGWLGLPLAEALAEKKYQVKGSTTSDDKLKLLKKKGIEPFKIKLVESSIEGDINNFLESEILILNIPPSSISSEQKEFRELIHLVDESPVSQLLFVSSTSVYPNYCGEVVESFGLNLQTTLNGKLFEMEAELKNMKNTKFTIVRFGGLIGYERDPGMFLAGRRKISDPFAPVNLIHRDDCLGILTSILQKGVWGEVFNSCADTHPTKKEFYTAAAKRIGLVPPEFERSDKGDYKVINNSKTKEMLDYSFIVSDLLDFARKGN